MQIPQSSVFPISHHTDSDEHWRAMTRPRTASGNSFWPSHNTRSIRTICQTRKIQIQTTQPVTLLTSKKYMVSILACTLYALHTLFLYQWDHVNWTSLIFMLCQFWTKSISATNHLLRSNCTNLWSWAPVITRVPGRRQATRCTLSVSTCALQSFCFVTRSRWAYPDSDTLLFSYCDRIGCESTSWTSTAAKLSCRGQDQGGHPQPGRWSQQTISR